MIMQSDVLSSFKESVKKGRRQPVLTERALDSRNFVV